MSIAKQPQDDFIHYPSSDGKPMADNTLQARWIITLYNNLKGMYHQQNVFVAADLFWYPVQGDPRTVVAPDVMVVLGRPDGDRMSYQQWKEENTAPQVVFEILSPSNTTMEMLEKQFFYQKHGVEEFIVIDPGEPGSRPEKVAIYERHDGQLRASDFHLVDWTSRQLGIRFRQEGEILQPYYPDGRPFLSFEAIQAKLTETEGKLTEAEAEIERLKARLKDLGESE